MKIYTRTGDDGSTGRLYGGRVAKWDPIVDTSGDVDEVVALLGVARATVHQDQQAIGTVLMQVQRDLFVLGADLAVNPHRREKLQPGVSKVTDAMITGVEELIDVLIQERPLRPVFIVPGATPASAAIDHARAVARRAERHALAAREAGAHVSDAVGRYLNRLSDLLFVLARQAAGEAVEPTTR